MSDNTWIVIPTYWGANGTKDHPSDTGDFDHPTEIDGPKTLERTIKNITSFPDNFRVLVILAVTHNEYRNIAKICVQEILLKYKNRKDIFLVCNEDIDKLNNNVAESSLNLKTYGAIRNISLAIPYFLGAKVVIAIDDDEIISDKQYFEKVSNLMKNDDIDILSGVYLNHKGSYLLPKVNKRDPNPYVQKLNLINSVVTESMTNKIQPHKTHIGFGGNMIFKRKIIENICFDEYIPRGEDFDYILNALASNFSAYFDKDIPITHLPLKLPVATERIRVASDIKRHLYTYYKKKALKWNVNQDIYPGEFLKDIEKLKHYSILAYQAESHKTIGESRRAIESIIEEVILKKDIYAKQKLRWTQFIEIFHKNKEMNKNIIKWVNGLKVD